MIQYFPTDDKLVAVGPDGSDEDARLNNRSELLTQSPRSQELLEELVRLIKIQNDMINEMVS